MVNWKINLISTFNNSRTNEVSKQLKYISLLLLVFANCLSFANSKIFYADTLFTKVSTHPYTKHYHDVDENKSPIDLLSIPKDSFHYFEKPFLFVGYGTHTNWFLVELENQKDVDQIIYFCNQQVSVTSLDVFVVNRDFIIETFPTQDIRRDTRYVNGKYYFFPINIKAGEKYTLIVKFRNPYGSVRPNFEFYSNKEYHKYNNARSTELKFYFFFLGIYSIMLLLSLITFILRKEKIYLFYFFFAFFNLSGIIKRACLFLDFYKNFPFLPFEPGAYTTIFLLISGLLFFYEFNKPFIQIKVYHFLYKFLIWYMPIYFFVGHFIHYTNPLFIFQTKIIIFNYLLVALLCVLYCIEGIRAKNRPSLYLLFSLSVYFYFAVVSTLFLSGLNNDDTTQYSQEISVGFEIFVISILLISRLAKVFKENKTLQEKLNEEQVNFIKKSIEIQNQERARISKDLHDDIGQQLTGLKLMWFNIRKQHQDQVNSDKFSNVLERTIENVRQLSHQMMPAHLLKAGLDKSIEGLCTSYDLENHTIEYDSFNIPEIFEEQLILNLYRIVQESISNALKHGKASVIQVNIRYVKNKLILTITDNGLGFDTQKMIKGFGLVNLESRVQLIGGNYTIESEKNNGTTIIVRILYS